MKPSWKRGAWVLLVIVLAVVFVGRVMVPGMVEHKLNPVQHAGPYLANAEAHALHRRLLIADLHADSLLWDRDLVRRGSRGQVDIPRLIEGNVALQAFTIVTKSPKHVNIEKNDADSDDLTLLAMASGWPVKTWGSLTERALYQAQKLHDFADHSDGQFSVIHNAAELDAYLARRQSSPHITAGFLGVEGAHALEGNLDNIDRLYAAGIRMMAPTHFFDNDMGGSAHGMNKAGLTAKGREMIRRMEAKHMLLDLAHAAPKTIDDALAMAKRPVLVSHTGVKGTCNNQRNLSDQQLRGVANTGGVVGIGYWSTAVCGNDAAAVARAIVYAVRLIGTDHVALGSDFDGAVGMPFDTAGLVLVTQALQQQGLSGSDISKIMGGNVIKLLRRSLS